MRNGAKIHAGGCAGTNVLRTLSAVTLLTLLLFAAACDISGGDDGPSGLSITGIPAEYNGKYVSGWGMLGDDDDAVLVAARRVDVDMRNEIITMTGVRVSSGGATLKVWTFDEETGKVAAFTGSGAVSFMVYFSDTEKIDDDYFYDEPEEWGIVEVTLFNGTGSEVFMGGGERETNGRLTIIDIPPEYNGKYLFADADFDGSALTGLGLIAAAGMDGFGDSGTAGRISSGGATLKVWKKQDVDLTGFNGTGTVRFDVFIRDSASFDYYDAAGEAAGYVEATFTGGIGSGEFVKNDIFVMFSGLSADGGETETTTALTLTFNKAIEGLAAGDITVTAAETGGPAGTITTGTLGPAAGTGPVTYTLPISGFTSGGTVNVEVEKDGYNIAPAQRPVLIYCVEDDEEDEPFPEDGTLAEQLAWLGTYAESNTPYTLEVSANGTLAPQTLSYTGKTGITITLKGLTSERVISLASSASNSGSLFTVGSGVTLILDSNITLKGLAANTAPLVRVNGGTLNMKAGSKITDNTAEDEDGGGVYIQSGTFTMNGGTISGNSADAGGGVYVGPDGTFTMKGGTISGNSADAGGGVYVAGTFHIENGTIYGSDESDTTLQNTADDGAALYVDDDGEAEYGTFDEDDWTTEDDLDTADDTITVEDGELN